jgi:hypothetical protein
VSASNHSPTGTPDPWDRDPISPIPRWDPDIDEPDDDEFSQEDLDEFADRAAAREFG